MQGKRSDLQHTNAYGVSVLLMQFSNINVLFSSRSNICQEEFGNSEMEWAGIMRKRVEGGNAIKND